MLVGRVPDARRSQAAVGVVDVDERGARPVGGLGERDGDLPVRRLRLDEEGVSGPQVEAPEDHGIRVPLELVWRRDPAHDLRDGAHVEESTSGPGGARMVRSSGAWRRISSTYDATASSSPTSVPSCSERYQRWSRIWWNTSAAGSLFDSSAGTRRDCRLEDLGAPAVGGDRLRHRVPLPSLELGAEPGEIVEHPPRLALLGAQAGEHQQAVAVVARLDDPWVEPQPEAAVLGDQLDLLDVEAELVQPVETLLDPVALVGSDQLLVGQLVPERLVAALQLDRRLDRVEVLGQADLGVDVEELADHVLGRDRQVVQSLAGRELRLQLAGLRVDEIGGERARVTPEERVRERAVAPEEAGEMQADEQLGERADERRAQARDRAAGEQRSVGKREVQMPGDQDRVEVGPAVRDDAHHLDHGHRLRRQVTQQPVLAPRQRLGQLLERVDRVVVAREPDHVAADAAEELHEPLVIPVLERLLPREVEEVGMPGPSDELQARGHASSVPARDV